MEGRFGAAMPSKRRSRRRRYRESLGFFREKIGGTTKAYAFVLLDESVFVFVLGGKNVRTRKMPT